MKSRYHVIRRHIALLRAEDANGCRWNSSTDRISGLIALRTKWTIVSRRRRSIRHGSRPRRNFADEVCVRRWICFLRFSVLLVDRMRVLFSGDLDRYGQTTGVAKVGSGAKNLRRRLPLKRRIVVHSNGGIINIFVVRQTKKVTCRLLTITPAYNSEYGPRLGKQIGGSAARGGNARAFPEAPKAQPRRGQKGTRETGLEIVEAENPAAACDYPESAASQASGGCSSGTRSEVEWLACPHLYSCQQVTSRLIGSI